MKSFLCLAILVIFFPVPLPVTPYLAQAPREIPKSDIFSAPAAFPSRAIRSVVIDAGHGGKDYGAVSPWGIREKDLALEIARAVRDELKENGIRVIMTRDRDRFIPLSNRAKIANEKDADLFVSIHANAAASPELRGFEVYYLSDSAPAASLSALPREGRAWRVSLGYPEIPTGDLRAALLDLRTDENRRQAVRLAGFVRHEVGNAASFSVGRLRPANFYVLRATDCPAALVEIGYLTNREDAAQLGDSGYKQKLAGAITRGILNYQSEFDRTNGFSR